MIATIAKFELGQRLRRISTYVYFVVFFGLGFLFVTMSAGAIPGATVDFGTGGRVLVNSPYALFEIVNYMGLFFLIVTAALAGQATYQDIDNNCSQFFFSAPITKFQYLAGRFLGILALQLIIVSSVGLGSWLGTVMPWLDPTRLGPQHFISYLQPYLLLVLPNLVLTSAIFFAMAAIGRRMLPVYAASVLMLIGYLVAQQLSTSLTAGVASSLADPFGSNATDRLTYYWTPFERNTRLVPLMGILFWNRVLWLSVGFAIFAFTYFKFRFGFPAQGAKRRAKAVDLSGGTEAELTVSPEIAVTTPVAQSSFTMRASFGQLISLTGLQFLETIKNVFFIVLVFAGTLFAIFVGLGINSPADNSFYPVTWRMVELAGGGFYLFALAIITFYSGELVWRERDAQLNQMMDALPVRRWVLFGSKLGALLLIQILLILMIMVSGVFVQIVQGYHHFQFSLYLRDLFGREFMAFSGLCVLAFLVHTIVNQKYLGHFVMVLYFIGTIALPLLGWQHYLYRYDETPTVIYSDMNAYGPFAAPLFWFRLYWAIAAILLAVLTNLLWVRGMETSWRSRLKLVRERFTGPTTLTLAAGAITMALVGGYIFYNTNVLNPYRPTFKVQEARAQYEKKYRQYRSMPLPKITDNKVNIDLYPYERLAAVHGRLSLENRTGVTIDRIAVTVWPEDVTPIPRPEIEQELSFEGGATPVLEDSALGFFMYRLATPLPPGGRMALDYSLKYPNHGFVNSDPNGDIVHNGSFLSVAYTPFIGYFQDLELIDDSARHRHGLEDAPGLPPLDDVVGRNQNPEANDADWPTFEGTISTSPDQIAIMPGYLQREWSQDGRHYFQYKADTPILAGIFSANSGRYAVQRDHWNNVNLEIYYQPGHEFNLNRMQRSMKATLAYCTLAFSPFQFRQVRIIEFPRYGTFAESFPNTIPYSEGIGFITYVPNKPDAVDMPFYITAHEVAHQWWGHQVVSGNTVGQTMVVETLAQYTALMVMKHAYGPESMKRFLRWQLDGYLRGRAQEHNVEEPLYKVQALQGYIHYNKGGQVMYALQDYIGEDQVNQALAAMIKDYAFKGPPYPTSLDLISHLRAVTPAEYQYLLEDFFETITIFDNHARSATYTQLPDGRYQVKLVVESKKYRADGHGHEQPAPLHDLIDIGVLDASGNFLYLQKQRIDQEQSEFTVTVDKLPAQAGIDPLIKLIDRNPDDNVVKVEKQSQSGGFR